ncbi:hypothetical protein MMC31_003918, partial [Peltigera leucophlebia]|nr:hypothetical protein [Peltigera leucophlebia]
MTDQATIQASKSNTTKANSPISENLGLKRETVSPSTDSLEDEESPRRARSSSPTFISRENSQQLQKRPSMPSESKESPALLQGESPTSEVCLCQPDPKVPRPRNAFILYRQHHQSAVVEQNPGLSNPEISKVIGEHWKASPQEIQTHWRNLAEQEKLRHQKQYPDYRYQPRRSRNHSISASSSGDRENLKCQKCGGYSIPKSSGIMSTPGIVSPPTDLVSPADRHPSTSSTNSIAYRSLRDPSPASATANFARSRGSVGSYSSDLAALQLASPRLNKRSEPDSPHSPPPEDSKRFRAVNGLGIQGLRGAPNTPYPFLRKSTAAESGAHHPRSESVHSQPQQHQTLKPGSGSFTMGPPPRPQQHHPGGSSTSTPTSSSSGPLTLNPLHSVSPTTLDSPASAQAKSLE